MTSLTSVFLVGLAGSDVATSNRQSTFHAVTDGPVPSDGDTLTGDDTPPAPARVPSTPKSSNHTTPSTKQPVLRKAGSTSSAVGNTYAPLPAGMPKADKRKAILVRAITPNPVHHGDDHGDEVDPTSIQEAKRRFILSKESVQLSIVSTSTMNNDTAKIKTLDTMICSASFPLLTDAQQEQVKDKYFNLCINL